jgi:hypothetical protein
MDGHLDLGGNGGAISARGAESPAFHGTKRGFVQERKA